MPESIEAFGMLLGEWATEATHPAMPGVVVRGTASFEWLEGERFLIVRARTDHPQFPDSVSVISDTDGMRMHYFDSRGVSHLRDGHHRPFLGMVARLPGLLPAVHGNVRGQRGHDLGALERF
jgi:hypothetical protein